MLTAMPLQDLLTIEKLCEQEREEARVIQGAMLPSQPLHIGSVLIMPGPILIRDGKCEALHVAGIPPGLFPGVSYDEYSLQIEHGDSLLFCSDGLTEARNVTDDEFEVEGLARVCALNANAAPLDLLEQVLGVVQTFSRNTRQWDDMTAAVFHYS